MAKIFRLGLTPQRQLHANFIGQPYDYMLNKDCETGVGLPSWMGSWWLRPPAKQYSQPPVPMVPGLCGHALQKR